MKLLACEDEEDVVAEPEEDQPPAPALSWRWVAAIAVGAAVPRLLYLFVFSNPENPGLGVYDDVWHHWQIAYLTKEVGLGAPDGPRLWDLKGLDYFWGILHPLLMVLVFAITGSTDIVLLRLVSTAFGVLGVVLIFDICRRLWNAQVALAAAALVALLPTSVMNDASGMLEPMAVALCLLGIWAWLSRRGFWSGVALGVATMARAEAWLFGVGLIIAANLRRINVRQLPGLWFGFGATVALYMWILLAKTGNPIYPLWWNFFANALGQWGRPITSSQVSVRPALGVVLVLGLAGLAWALYVRPHGYMLFTFGFGYWVFTTGMLGFTSFLSTWQWWMPISRRFEFPYAFAGILLAVAIFHLLPWRFALPSVGAAVLASQLLWLPISAALTPTDSAWRGSVADASELASLYHQAPYEGHMIAVPPDRPEITYGLAHSGGVDGRWLLSEMYSPLAYLPAGYRLQDHMPAVNAQVQCWLRRHDARLIAIAPNDNDLESIVQFTPQTFQRLGILPGTGWEIYAVSASSSTC